MGLYSSWAALALSHHVIVWLAAHKAGHKDPFAFYNYSICGDDIVIANTKVAREYRQICGDLGLEINPSKTFVGTHYAEYMKTLFVRGEIMSTLPLASLALRPSFYTEDAIILLEHLFDRGITLDLKKFLALFKLSARTEVYAAITCPANRIYYPTEL